MIDVALQLAVIDGSRRFELDIAFACDAPVVALYGPSGAGKSLTLQAMAGLLAPAAGWVRIAHRSLYDSRAGIDVPTPQRRLGYLFQHYALFPHLSVRDNVAFGLTSWRKRLEPADASRVDALLASFGLQDMASARPSKLSGGQQQRVALARALACNPDALLLDEPFAALNPLLRQSLREELAEVRRQWQIPIVMISHDIEDVLALANVAYLVEEGRIVREVDLDRAESRAAQRDALLPAALRRPRRPHEDTLRRLLGAAPGHA
ncbi:ATP-binding cassette domain-containing protein [Piscinibacter sp. XHJ-5]|uniref:ATP-binding cassette domain-containing protein n=1 Tax=Piscinibacter sp. XHJ-5 TaxID=3037797 RepID=UPI00245280F7|nr:ATP-binding cassette domain-containing protein [Piscinibacter sp. XHJ-5]